MSSPDPICSAPESAWTHETMRSWDGNTLSRLTFGIMLEPAGHHQDTFCSLPLPCHCLEFSVIDIVWKPQRGSLGLCVSRKGWSGQEDACPELTVPHSLTQRACSLRCFPSCDPNSSASELLGALSTLSTGRSSPSDTEVELRGTSPVP